MSKGSVSFEGLDPITGFPEEVSGAITAISRDMESTENDTDLSCPSNSLFSYSMPHVIIADDHFDDYDEFEERPLSDSDDDNDSSKVGPKMYSSKGFNNLKPELKCDPSLSIYPIISVGEKLPCAPIVYRGQTISINDSFGGSIGVVIGAIGAFNPICTEMHLPGFRDLAPEFAALNVELFCLTVNDPFVTRAWRRWLKISTEITFLCDPAGSLCRRLGILEDYSSTGLGFRCKRCAIITGPRSIVRWIGFDEESFAPSVLRNVKK